VVCVSVILLNAVDFDNLSVQELAVHVYIVVMKLPEIALDKDAFDLESDPELREFVTERLYLNPGLIYDILVFTRNGAVTSHRSSK